MGYIKSFLKKLWGTYLYYKFKRLYNKDPKLAADALYLKINGRHINLDNPSSLIEKITWLSLNTDTSLWTLCADKYRMRNYVEAKGWGEYLPKCYGFWEEPNDIDFSKLPDRFVLKANNGCATVIIVHDKNKQNEVKVKKQMKRWLNRPFGYMGAQKHYLSIKPGVIAEELLIQSKDYDKISPNSIVDFKIWCFKGIPESILVCYDRQPGNLKIALFDTEWKPISQHLNSSSKDTYHPEITITKPSHFNKMLEIASSLSKDFDEVRIDFYNTDEKAVLGEMTFTTGYGYFTDEYYKYLGDKINIKK